MIGEGMGLDCLASTAIEQWSAYLEELHARIAGRFRRPEVKERARGYLLGLFGEVGRKNGWQMAEKAWPRRDREAFSTC